MKSSQVIRHDGTPAGALAAIGDALDSLIEEELERFEAMLLDHSDDEGAINSAVAEQHRVLLAARRRGVADIEAELGRAQSVRSMTTG